MLLKYFGLHMKAPNLKKRPCAANLQQYLQSFSFFQPQNRIAMYIYSGYLRIYPEVKQSKKRIRQPSSGLRWRPWAIPACQPQISTLSTISPQKCHGKWALSRPCVVKISYPAILLEHLGNCALIVQYIYNRLVDIQY